MQDLGYISPPPKQALGATPVTIISESEASRKPQYPHLSFNGEQAEKAGLDKCTIGQEYEITIRIKATQLGNDSYPFSSNDDDDRPGARFDVIASDTPEPTDSSTEEAPEDKKVKPQTVPPGKSRVLSPKMSGMKDAYDEED